MAYRSFCTRTALLHGVEAEPVVVEVNASQGIPGITIVGLADAAVQEAKYRVQCAFKESGYEWPRSHFTINLAPSEQRKSGTGFDLPIAVAMLASTGQIPTKDLDGCLFVGELALTGQVSPVRGLVAYEYLAREQGLTVVGPATMTTSVGAEVRRLDSLAQLRQGVGSLPVAPGGSAGADAADGRDAASDLDFADVAGQELAKRALVIAASGDHGLLMVGPPGAGKSMMARRLPSILSPLTEDERAEVLLIHSVAGQELQSIREGVRPFRAPHHSVTRAGLIGGGRPIGPGEVSLAHRGVLYLDELPEFGPSVLQALRQPIETGRVCLVRADGKYFFPCEFMLVAAANPCPCGYLGDPDHTCTCPASRIQMYQSRIGGPLMDRIDVLVDVARPSSRKIIAGDTGMSSAQMAEQVRVAREFSSWRRRRTGDGVPDRKRNVRQLGLDTGARSTLEGVAERLALGGRNIVRVARVARTVADLAQSEEVHKEHVMEACAYRTRATL